MLGKVMIDSIRAWIAGSLPSGLEGTGRRRDELQLALTALLIEAAYSDDHFDKAERAIIAQLIERRFKLSPASRVLAESLSNVAGGQQDNR